MLLALLSLNMYMLYMKNKILFFLNKENMREATDHFGTILEPATKQRCDLIFSVVLPQTLQERSITRLNVTITFWKALDNSQGTISLGE